jgi:DNA-binding NarL/FixJ family response regulator
MLKDSFKELQILLFSNLSERELEKAAKTCRADGYICKQTPPPEWIKKIREVVPPIA